MHDITNWVLPLGILLLLGTMVGWWRDVVKEATFQGHHNAVVQIGLRSGMALFIASEVMFFAAFFCACFSSALYPAAATGGTWLLGKASCVERVCLSG